MQNETKIILDIIKRYFIFIFILPLFISTLIYFYIRSYEANSAEHKRYYIYTDTSDRTLTLEVDKYIHKFDNINLAYDKKYRINSDIINQSINNEVLIMGKFFRQFAELITSDDSLMNGINPAYLVINENTPTNIYQMTFTRDTFLRIKIDFFSYINNKQLIRKSFTDAINKINSNYSIKIHENNLDTLSLLIKDIKVAIKTNDHLIETLDKQKISSEGNSSLKNNKDIELEIIFLKEYKKILLDIIKEIDIVISSKEVNKLKLINDITNIDKIDDQRINYILKYLHINSYFLLLILILVFAVIYEYNFKRKD